jgi:hypothetical protein
LTRKIALFFAIIFLLLSIFILIVFSKNGEWTNQTNSFKDVLDLKFTVLNPFSKKEKTKSVYLVAGWDIMLSRNIWFLGKLEGYDRIFWSWNYNPISEFTGCNDENCILFFNLESLFYTPDNDIRKWWFLFRANTGNIQTLLQLKGNKDLVLSLANNHTINGWFRWVNMTKELLDDNEIYHIWVGLDLEESRKIGVIVKNDIKICSQAYSYDWQYVKVWEWKISWNKINEKDIIEDIHSMKFLDCDVKIIMLHWWAEYYTKPNTSQRTLAKSLIQAWADLIFWWHSHVPWVFTKIDDKFVFYSLGNFIFDQRWGIRSSIKNANYIYDYNVKRYTVPTYISLLWGLEITKSSSGVDIKLDKIVMSEVENWIHSPLNEETYQWIYDNINEIE